VQTLTNKRILLGITGGIAAYKAADLTRRLQDQGADVRVVMTRGATEFITPLTLQALSNHTVHLDLLSAETESAMGHIELARWADLIIVAPATADFIARLAIGRGDDLLTTVCLAAECRIAIAPAMNQAMWANKATQENCKQLQARNIIIFGPEDGRQACGETGTGRLLGVDKIVIEAASLFASGLLSGKKVVITAGPTREAIDPVRYISNHSSGKQGFALAEAALEAGAMVTLVSGPTDLEPPERIQLVPVISAKQMYDAVMEEIPDTDLFIGVAAVADYRPVVVEAQKIKKNAKPINHTMTLNLIENPDIIAAVANAEKRPFTVGFAAETNNLIEYARKKLIQKGLDMIVANNVADSLIGFNSDENQTAVLWENHVEDLPRMSKYNLSRRIIELIATRLKQVAL
jgi:phosphopantothenoylcysteine decarboxylase/phosphopantothenate--cysteine ligase|tara:strand:- start:1526 stop:2743 length:1218 start_codon:yes stop_codon:yes gene_type:complete